MNENEIYQKEETSNLERPTIQEPEQKTPKLKGLIFFVILAMLILIAYYFYNPACNFQRVGNKYPAIDDCNICLCTLKGFICTNLDCKNIKGTIASEFEELCNWEPGNCDRACSYPEGKYFFIKEAATCERWKSGNCCTDPPFRSLEECQLICVD